MTRPGYWRDWRAAHPEYRKREVARVATRRVEVGRESRVTEYANRAARAVVLPPSPVPFTGHPIFDRAREIVGPDRSGMTVWLDPLHEELLAVATLALVEGSDPVAAVKAYRSTEFVWRRMAVPVYEVAA